jgi:hypothetical protein
MRIAEKRCPRGTGRSLIWTSSCPAPSTPTWPTTPSTARGFPRSGTTGTARPSGIIGGTTFPTNLKRDPRCALAIVDWDPATGLSHHVGLRGRAEVLPFDPALAKTSFRRYFGPDEEHWDRWFDDVFTGELGLEMVRFTPETVIMRDQSYKPTRWTRQQNHGEKGA